MTSQALVGNIDRKVQIRPELKILLHCSSEDKNPPDMNIWNNPAQVLQSEMTSCEIICIYLPKKIN